MLPSNICGWTCPQPIFQPQDATGQRRIPGQRLWLGGAARAKTNGSFLPARVTGNFRWRGQEDASGTWYCRLWLMGLMEVREVWDPRLVGGTASSTRGGRCQKTGQGGEGIFHTSTANAGVGLKGGHSPGSPCTAMSLQKEVYAPSWLHLYMQGHLRDPEGKVVAYARALQYWAEQNNLPARGEPHLLARSVLELREEVRWYLSFTDEEIFKGLALPEEEEEESLQTPGPTDLPEAPCVPEPVLERRAPKFVGWEKVLHPSQPVVATGDIPRPTRTPRSKVEARQTPQRISMKPPVSPPKTPTLPQPSPLMHALLLTWLPTPPQGFTGITACLSVPKLVEVDLELPVGLMPMELVAAPGITSMSSSHIVKDELTGVTYMDTVTTSVGRVTISSPGLGAFPTGPTIEDIMDSQ